MASEVGICNMALSHIGEDGIIVSINPADGSANAGHCARFYGIARNDILEMFEWSFATKRAMMAQVINDSAAWAFKFALPSDCIKPRKLLSEGAWQEAISIDYLIESGHLYCNEEKPTLVYTMQVADTTRFSSMFTSAVSYKLASYIAGPIVKKAALVSNMLEIAMSVAAKASALDANASSSETHGSPAPWMTERGGQASPYSREGYATR